MAKILAYENNLDVATLTVEQAIAEVEGLLRKNEQKLLRSVAEKRNDFVVKMGMSESLVLKDETSFCTSDFGPVVENVPKYHSPADKFLPGTFCHIVHERDYGI